MTQRTGNAIANSAPTVPAPKASKQGASSAATKSKKGASTIATASKVKKAKISAVADIPETPGAPAQPRPCPRPRPRSQASKALLSSQDQPPETPLAPSTRRADDALQATPVNVATGVLSDDESDTEEYAAAKSSPIKAGKRITSNVSSDFAFLLLILTSCPIGHHCDPAWACCPERYTQAFP